MYYHDGSSPPPDVIEKWLKLVNETFSGRNVNEEKPSIALHCVAGLGRAPVLVAIALIEYGMDAISAVSFIRERRLVFVLFFKNRESYISFFLRFSSLLDEGRSMRIN